MSTTIWDQKNGERLEGHSRDDKFFDSKFKLAAYGDAPTCLRCGSPTWLLFVRRRFLRWVLYWRCVRTPFHTDAKQYRRTVR